MKRTGFLSACAALAALGVLPGVLPAQSSAAEAMRPFQFLLGSCWRGTFPNGTTSDEHCFEPLHDAQFVRDRHVVRGGRAPYSGETTYAWDPAAGRIVYWYIASSGAFSTGIVEPVGDTIVIPETHVSAAGTRKMRNVWRRTGDDSYSIEVFDVSGAEARLLWSMEMKRRR